MNRRETCKYRRVQEHHVQDSTYALVGLLVLCLNFLKANAWLFFSSSQGLGASAKPFCLYQDIVSASTNLVLQRHLEDTKQPLLNLYGGESTAQYIRDTRCVIAVYYTPYS